MVTEKIDIGGHPIVSFGTPFIVAEAGINHNGEIEKAFEMIRVAKDAGANAIKFQTFRADEFISDPKLTFSYQSQGKTVTESMLEMFRRYEFTPNEWRQVKRKCEDEKILFLSTPQNVTDLELLLEIGIPAIKVGSDDFTNLPLLRNYAKTGLPLILSCGMADLEDVHQALGTVGTLAGYPTILLVCTSQYPTPPDCANLLRITTLAKTFPGLPIGFSDHTQGSLASSLAVALGSPFFEKHFTLDHQLPGPDHWFSSDPAELKEWVLSIRKAYVILGSPVVQPTSAETKMRDLARRSVVALSDIKRGETFSAENLGLKRPGVGLPPSAFDQAVGRKARRNIAKGALLAWDDFSDPK